MSDYIISTTSTTDLPESYVKENQLSFIPYIFLMNDREYQDDFGKSVSFQDFYNQVREGAMPSTSMINREIYEEHFTSLLEQGKDVVHIEFSSALSGSYANGKDVADRLNQSCKYPNQIYFIDSLCASMGQGLLVDYAVKLKRAGKTAEEVAAWLEENKRNILHWFTVDDLNHLRRGGRVSKASAFFGTMLKIKPILDVDDQGRLIPHFKVRGRKKAVAGLLEQMKQDILEPDGQTVFISHGDCIEDAKKLEAMVREAFPTITDILINYIGPVIGSHSGPGTLALFYRGKHRYQED